MKKTLCSVISLLLCITFLLSACASTSNTAEAEQVAIAYYTALARGDGKGVLALVHDNIREKDMRLCNYTTNKEYEDYLNERMTQLAADWFGGTDDDPSVQVTEAAPLSGDELQRTKEHYKDFYDLDVDQAVQVSCHIKANGKEVDRDYPILKIGNTWYVS